MDWALVFPELAQDSVNQNAGKLKQSLQFSDPELGWALNINVLHMLVPHNSK